MAQITNLNIEEKQAIEEFQLRVKNDLTPKLLEDPSLYYRFLKARDFNIIEAEKMLRKHIEWRKTMQMDTILEDFKPKEFYLKHLSPTVVGCDRHGDIIVYVPLGKTDTKDVTKAMKMNDILYHITWFTETAIATKEKKNAQTGKGSYQAVLILDLDKLTLSNAANRSSQETMVRVICLSQDNFPERLKTVYVINAPYYYMVIYTVMKTVMSKGMLKKFKVFGRNGWKGLFQEVFDTDTLPAFLGGIKTDPDGNPECRTFVRHVGKTPPIYYLSEEDRYFENTSNVEKILIRSRNKKEVYIDVTENGSRIEWRFLVKGRDIGFGLFLQTLNQTKEDILPIVKFSTIDGTEEGFYKCKSVGKYVFIFDNTYSWLSSKEVEYSIKVIQND